VYFDFLVYILYSSIFLRHQTMDKVPKVQFVQYQHTIVRILQKLFIYKVKGLCLWVMFKDIMCVHFIQHAT